MAITYEYTVDCHYLNMHHVMHAIVNKWYAYYKSGKDRMNNIITIFWTNTVNT